MPSPTASRGILPLAAAVLVVVAAPPRLVAAPATATVSLRLPITGARDTQAMEAILRLLPRLRGKPHERGVLVLRFDGAANPDAAGRSDFGRAVELARFLAGDRVAGVKTVAWLPEGASGHAVLVALACEEIVMAPDAVLGPAGGGEPAVDDATRAAYVQIASHRRTVPPAVALGLVDPAARVVRVSTDAGEQFVEERDLDAVRRQAAVLNVEELRPVPLAIPGRRCRELGFVRLVVRSPAELARGLGVSEREVAADPAVDGGWRPVQVPLAGAVTGEAVGRVRGRIERAIADGANLVCLRIESAGGAPEQSLVLANWLAGLDAARVRTVAYVPREARGDAALVALACDEIAIAPQAVLGGEGEATIDERRADAIRAAWSEGVAKTRDRSWSLPLALVTPGLVVQRAVEQASGRVEHFSDAELETRADRGNWQVGERVGVGPLALDGRRAAELGLAAHVVDGVAALRDAYGLQDDFTVVEPGWADRLLEALASPSLAWLLLLIGGAGLYIELKTPGVGFGGFVSMVAFIVYFWSQYLHGTSGWLEVMLFLAGLVCVAAEIFVLPGFGVLGLGGGLLVIASIVLASQSFVLPANDYQIGQMQRSLLGILGVVTGVTALGVGLRRWLPAAPFFRHVLLEPPAGDPELAGEALADLVGATGETTSRLAPAGRAMIRGEIRDVTSDGGLLEPHVTVQVVGLRGGRLVVRAAGPA